LAIVLFAGFVMPRPLAFLVTAITLRYIIIASVIFMTALVLETSEIWNAMRRPWATLLAVALNFGVLPLLAWMLSSSFLTGELALGVLVAATAPCTLASAAVWTRRAGGNDAVALMVTVVTNMACFVLTPLWLATTAGRADVEINLLEMMWKLALLVVLPMICAQVLRQNKRVGLWADRQKRLFAVLAQIGILFIVLTGAVKCGLYLRDTENAGNLAIGSFLNMAVCVFIIHVTVLVLGQLLGRVCGMPRGDWIAIGFASSQKTLPVGLEVAFMIGGGLMILPIVTYHVVQLLIDTIVADWLAGRGPARQLQDQMTVHDDGTRVVND
jgi:sodium/bile acid cotransporter 7